MKEKAMRKGAVTLAALRKHDRRQLGRVLVAKRLSIALRSWHTAFSAAFELQAAAGDEQHCTQHLENSAWQIACSSSGEENLACSFEEKSRPAIAGNSPPQEGWSIPVFALRAA